mmetsp:Transcript_56291/g.131903  ORF Transcript_56291/g.131903 Transcript_56291/m.131903 type:complete len:210 (-) Transcript_56291:168-797(-)
MPPPCSGRISVPSSKMVPPPSYAELGDRVTMALTMDPSLWNRKDFCPSSEYFTMNASSTAMSSNGSWNSCPINPFIGSTIFSRKTRKALGDFISHTLTSLVLYISCSSAPQPILAAVLSAADIRMSHSLALRKSTSKIVLKMSSQSQASLSSCIVREKFSLKSSSLRRLRLRLCGAEPPALLWCLLRNARLSAAAAARNPQTSPGAPIR